jgi:pSer/pThr/pTyr-binding forkhead associated (FHA) protein
MQAKLVVVEPATESAVYHVSLPLTIGRGTEATVKLVHALVSRQHCELFEDRGRLMVRDLGSRNGTFVGGKRIEVAPLPPNELLTIGSVTLRAVYGDDVQPAKKSAAEEAAAEETVGIEDTAEASYKNRDDEATEPLSWGEDDSQGFLNR